MTEAMTESESIGQHLRRLREEKNLPLEKVEDATKIRVDNLRAIECDEIASRVPVIYARGFIKTYAEFLGADGVELAKRFESLHGNVSPEISIPPVATLAGGRGVRLGRRSLLAILIGVAVVAVAVISYCLRAKLLWRYNVTVRAVGHVPIKVYRDGRFIRGSTIEPGKKHSWRGKKSIKLKITRPENARVIYRGRNVSLPEGDTVTVIFDRGGIRKQTLIPPEKPARTEI